MILCYEYGEIMLGFYDSGVGGISILKEFLKISPQTKFKYFADTEVLPLGDKSGEFIQNRTIRIVDFLFNSGCNLVVIACNTASVYSIRELQQTWLKKNYLNLGSSGSSNKNVLGVTKPLVEIMQSQFLNLNSKFGVILSTKATHVSRFYSKEFRFLGYSNFISIPTPKLAKIIESQQIENIKSYLQEVLSKKQILSDSIDYVVLACTHYTWGKKQIQEVFKTSKIIDPTQFIAQRLKDYLIRHPEYILSRQQNPQNHDKLKNEFYYTGSSDSLHNTFFDEFLNKHFKKNTPLQLAKI